MDDALTRLAQLTRVHPRLDLLCRFADHWAIPHEPQPDGEAPFHIVSRGTCTIELPDHGRSLALAAGDVMILPHGARHTLRAGSVPGDAGGEQTDGRIFARAPLRETHNGAVTLRTNTDGPASCELICGHFRFEQWRSNPLLGALPDVLHLATGQDRALARMGHMVETVRAELEEARPGAAAIATNLASALFTMIIRAHMEQAQDLRGILALLGHRTTGRAVVLMLEDPARAWTLEELAQASNTSRAGLVRAFRKQADVAPLGLLAQLRFQAAAQLLTATELPVAEVGVRVGYQAEEAFSRAFKRHFGVAPSEFRYTGVPRA
jgi:AraC-type DNA-binding domain-containing proteins